MASDIHIVQYLKKRKLLNQVLDNYSDLKPVIKDHLFFKSNQDQTIWGSVSEEDEAGIARTVEQSASLDGPIVEIGALFGFTTQLIATSKPIEKELIAVENFSWNPFHVAADDHRSITHRTLRYVMANCNTRIFDGSNSDFYTEYTGDRPSMIFIDADHSYEGVKVDIEWATKQKIPLICGHDYSALHPGVMRAVDEAFGGAVEVIGSVWIHRSG